MQQINQKEHPDREDEIDLKMFAAALFTRKLFISGLTVLFTLIAIIYTHTLTPNYITSVSFKLPSASAVLNFNQLPFIDKEIVTKESLFSHYLKVLSSKEFQKKVFLKGDYLTLINPKNEPIADVSLVIEGFTNGLEINPPESTVGKSLIENPYTAVFRGGDAETITKFLNDLIGSANVQTADEVRNLIERKTSNRLFEISSEIKAILTQTYSERLSEIERIKEDDIQKIREVKDEISSLRLIALEDRQNEIVRLNESAKLAKSLGVIENSFNELDASLLTANFSIDLDAVTPRMNQLPEWFLYGETALLERIQLLENRTNDDPFIPELVKLKRKLKKIQNNNYLKTLKDRKDDSPYILGLSKLTAEKITLESLVLDVSSIKYINLIKAASVPTGPINQNKRGIVLLGFFCGFLTSIFLILVMIILKPNEKNPA